MQDLLLGPKKVPALRAAFSTSLPIVSYRLINSQPLPSPVLCTSSPASAISQPSKRRSTTKSRSSFSSIVLPSLTTAAYIHLPFCIQRCAYCNFPVVVQSASTAASAEAAYLALLTSEIRAVAAVYPSLPPLTSVYFDGGTPSLTSVAGFTSLLETISAAFCLAPGAEITCEMDPATFSRSKAVAFRDAGVTRASLGAQSFDDGLLASCGRAHRSADIFEGMEALRAAGFGNVSLDVISGLPGQSLGAWEATLDAAVGLAPEHISCYDLELEDGTRFAEKYRAGVAPLPCDDDAADMVGVAAEKLCGAGYDHYEISSYAKEGRYVSVHNSAYWKSRGFYGFGLGATSLLHGPGELDDKSFRFERPRTMAGWTDYVESLARGGEVSCEKLFPGVAARDSDDLLQDYVINSMRLIHSGVIFADLGLAFGDDAVRRVQGAAAASGLEEIGLISTDSSGVRLTQKGTLFETTVLCGLLGF